MPDKGIGTEIIIISMPDKGIGVEIIIIVMPDRGTGMEIIMFQEYEKLSLTEKENFARIVNQLLGHTFLLVNEYDLNEGITRVNRDFLFVERNFELFRMYFEMAGFGLNRDTNYGVINLTSRFDNARVRMDKLATIMVYALRLIYEEERERMTLTDEVILTTGDLVHKLISLGAVRKKPANYAIHQALRTLAQFRIVRKFEGSWEDAGTRIMILPTILFVVSAEQITNMKKLIEPDPDAIPPDEDETDEEISDFE